MILVKALIKLHKGTRKTPIKSGYTPDFDFIKKTLTGGCIILLDRELMFPGEMAEVEIRFLYQEFLGKDFSIGTKLFFYEGQIQTGEGEVKSIIQWEEPLK